MPKASEWEQALDEWLGPDSETCVRQLMTSTEWP
jgi:hypothetical protein